MRLMCGLSGLSPYSTLQTLFALVDFLCHLFPYNSVYKTFLITLKSSWTSSDCFLLNFCLLDNPPSLKWRTQYHFGLNPFVIASNSDLIFVFWNFQSFANLRVSRMIRHIDIYYGWEVGFFTFWIQKTWWNCR